MGAGSSLGRNFQAKAQTQPRATRPQTRLKAIQSYLIGRKPFSLGRIWRVWVGSWTTTIPKLKQ